MDILRIAAIVLFVLAGVFAGWVDSVGLDWAIALVAFGLACLAASNIERRTL